MRVLASSIFGKRLFGDDLDDYFWIVFCYWSIDRGNIWKRKFASLVTLALVIRSVNTDIKNGG